MTFLLGGFLNAANKVPSMEPKAFLHKKKGLQCGKKIFPEKKFNKKLMDVGSESNNRCKYLQIRRKNMNIIKGGISIFSLRSAVVIMTACSKLM